MLHFAHSARKLLFFLGARIDGNYYSFRVLRGMYERHGSVRSPTGDAKGAVIFVYTDEPFIRE